MKFTTNYLQALFSRALIAIFMIALSACAYGPRVQEQAAPIVMVHGDGESAASWQDVVWRFESNGWPRARLFVLQQAFAQARDDDAKVQPGRSSNAEQLAFIKAEVARVLVTTGAKQVVLMGRGRGALAVRNYVQSGGAASVSHVVLAQPDAIWTGQAKALPLKDFDLGAFKDLQSLVLPLAEQRDGAFSATMFAASYRFITGQPPAQSGIWPQAAFALGGVITGMGPKSEDRAGPTTHYFNNLPLPGARLEIFAVRPDSGLRVGESVFRQVVGQDGRWGPFQAQSGVFYEFVVRANGYAVTHIYRSPFARGTDLLNLKASRISDADLPAYAIIDMERLRGTLDPTVHHSVLDGRAPPPGIQVGGVNPAASRVTLSKPQHRAIAAEVHTDAVERVVGRTWPAKDNHVVRLELSQ
jgi:triacylglycerol lipase